MATEVLRPQDLLSERFSVHPTSFHRRRVFPASSGNLTNLVVNRKQHRKTSPPKPDKKRLNAAAEANRSSHHRHGGVPVGQVTLLRRGESLSSIAGRKPSDRNRNSVDDMLVLKPIRPVAGPAADIYAGSAISMSPSPRSVPLPSFFNKKDSNDGATRDLRRLLRLE
ncbi:hypothetical protein PHJA_002504500 [Phtheirospermum japonicum]|uniref:Uncharacterized protein n=1 Tax=Phtheirospermum japonicum TaxID=374723 RepID=A0A830CWL3_9LAMI|nr:hypothetical protein PHJA_002504500 [Phtheirospermum japonicum]